MTMVRVLHVLGSLNAGGAESRTMDIYRAIDRSIIQFDFAIHTSENCFFTDEALQLGARIFVLPKFKGFNYYSYKKAWKDLIKKNSDLDIIHGHMTTTAFIYFPIAKKNGIKKRIAHARNSNKDSYIKKILSKLARFHSTDLLAVSKEAAISEFGSKLLTKKVRILPNLVDYSRYYFLDASRESIRKELRINNQKVIIHIGRFHKQKNHEFLIRLFYRYTKKIPETILLLIGEGVLKAEMVQLSEKLEIKDKILFLGNRTDVPDLLSAADCMIFPSFYEGLPGSLLEAQINSLPVITSNRVTKEVIISSKITFLSLNQPLDVWLNHLDLYLKNDRDLQTKNLIDCKFDLSKSINMIEDLYLENLSRK